ncbi:HAD family hydrolase [Pararhizobium sp. DWP1-1-3]|uniref:HAD family hydrolase n=1 Tax=Pararhizobium sp. DWP1-1-3 TaxID=2804652 RepID=UPI003CF265BF
MKIGIDFDGTLVTCRDKQIACLRDGLPHMHAKVNWPLVWRRKRNGHNNDRALAPYKLDEGTKLQLKTFWDSNIEAEHYQGYDKLFPGVLRTLQALRARHQLYLISARKHPEGLYRQLGRLGVSELFANVKVVSPQDAVQAKAKEFSDLGINCYIGDTESDFSASLAAQIPCYIVNTGQRSASFLKQSGVREIFEKLSAVEKVLNA